MTPALHQHDEIGRLTWREAVAVIFLFNAGLWGLAYSVGWWLS